MGNRYRNNYLKKVIIRLDFASDLQEVKEHIPMNSTKQILSIFPIAEPKTFIGKELQVSPTESKERIETGTNWFYHSKERDKTLCISTKYTWVAYNNYHDFETLMSDFLPICTELYEINNDLQVARLGLRYINNIETDNTQPYDWGDYLDDKLLSIFEVPKRKDRISRAFHNLTLNYDDMMLTFQYGMYNPDFPAVIKKKIFILDYDAYYEGLLSFDDIKSKLPTFHDEIENLFESCINDKLREIMGVI